MKTKIINWLEKIKHSAANTLFQAAPFVSLSKVETGQGKLAGLFAGSDLSSFISGLFAFAIALGAIIAVVRLMWAGYLYMGADMWTSKEEAKKIFTNVIIGLLLLLAIWLILLKINPKILNLQILTIIQSKPASGQNAPAATAGTGGGCVIGPNCSYCVPNTGVCGAPN